MMPMMPKNIFCILTRAEFSSFSFILLLYHTYMYMFRSAHFVCLLVALAGGCRCWQVPILCQITASLSQTLLQSVFLILHFCDFVCDIFSKSAIVFNFVAVFRSSTLFLLVFGQFVINTIKSHFSTALSHTSTHSYRDTYSHTHRQKHRHTHRHTIQEHTHRDKRTSFVSIPKSLKSIFAVG